VRLSFKLSVKHKIIGLAVIAGLVPVLVISLMTLVQKHRVTPKVVAELDILGRENIASVASDVYAMCQTAHDLIQQQVNTGLSVARQTVADEGGVRLSGETVSWAAVNQYNNQTAAVSLPKLLVGGRWVGQNRDTSTPTPVVDDVKKICGGTCTIFQRMNDQGDMLRVATNVQGKDHMRAIGTYIPSVNPDGSQNPVVSAVMRGEAYRGRAYVVDSWYITAYEPLRDYNGRVIGMLYMGVKQEAVEGLRKSIMEAKVGKTGYVYVLGGTGPEKGCYIISKGGERDGENIWEAKDADGNLFIQAIVNKALALSTGDVGYERYPWLNKGDARARMKIAAITYFQPFDWVIGAGSYEDDYYQAKTNVEGGLKSLLTWTVVCGVVLLACMTVIAFVIGSRMAKPIADLAKVSRRMATGDLSQTVDYKSEDEVGELAASFREMMGALKAKAEVAGQIAQGNLNVDVKALSSEDVLGSAMVTMRDAIGGLVEDVHTLVNAATEGTLNERADADRHRGDFRKIVDGINRTLDAVVTPIKESAEVLQKVAERDLTARVEGAYKGDHAMIKQALNTAVTNLDQGMQQVWTGSEQVSSAAAQIGSGSQALAQGSSEQASSLEEVSSSLEEMASMTQQNAANAKAARSLADAARVATEKGTESMHQLSGAVDKIKTSADETAKIIKTIDDIAFQTNLLALNAAVEAARAGDAGKGFAVVAEEVRNLAMRSAEAAKNTANMIEGSVKNAEGGVSLNQVVISNLAEINEQVHRVSEVMAEIATASEQQSVGIEQINTAVDQLNQLTQQNAANSEESASTSEELSAQAEELRSMVTNYKLTGISGEARVAPVRKAAVAPRPVHAEKRVEKKTRPAMAPGRSTTPQNADMELVGAGVGAGSPGRLAAGRDPRAVIPLDESDREVLRSF
jgi:methyl-accepting chemotaxis protein